MIDKLKQLIDEKLFWTKGRIFSINRETGEVVIKSHNDFQKIYYDPTLSEAGVYVGEAIKYKLIPDATNPKKKNLVVRTYDRS